MMRRVMFDIVRDNGVVVYPDSTDNFSNSEVKEGKIFADYSGDLPLTDAPPEILPAEISPLSFVRLFTPAERKTIRKSNNEVVIDFMDLLTYAGSVKNDDVDTVGALTYMESIGILASGRKEEILGGFNE